MDSLYRGYIKTDNNLIIMNASRASWRCRQRNIFMDGRKVPSFNFISYKKFKSLNRPIYQIYYNALSKL